MLRKSSVHPLRKQLNSGAYAQANISTTPKVCGLTIPGASSFLSGCTRTGGEKWRHQYQEIFLKKHLLVELSKTFECLNNYTIIESIRHDM